MFSSIAVVSTVLFAITLIALIFFVVMYVRLQKMLKKSSCTGDKKNIYEMPSKVDGKGDIVPHPMRQSSAYGETTTFKKQNGISLGNDWVY